MAHRRGLEPALIIVVIGIAVSFLPGFEAPELDSHILLSVVLPPLLYSAALDFSFPTFLRNIRPILGLGVGLVVVTAFAVALVSSWLVVVPLTFGTALVLGAIVAPPDAVTAVAVGRKLGLPKRVMAILTGREPHQRRRGADAVLHRGGPGRRHATPSSRTRSCCSATAPSSGPLVGAALGLRDVVDPTAAGQPRSGDGAGAGGAVRGVHLRRGDARLGCAGGRRRRLRRRQRHAGRRIPDAAAGTVRVELGRRAARSVRVRLHRIASAVRAGGSARDA